MCKTMRNYANEEYVINFMDGFSDGEYIGKVADSPRYKLGTKHVHFKIGVNGNIEIFNELIINRFEIFNKRMAKVNCGIGEENSELLYDAKKRSYILFPFSSIEIGTKYVKGTKRIKKENENIDLIMMIDNEGNIASQLFCTYDYRYYDINPDGSNINEIIEMIINNAKKDGALLERMLNGKKCM